MQRLLSSVAGMLVLLILGSCTVFALIPASNHELIENLTYTEYENLSMSADIYIPGGQGPFPAVVVIHGGGWVGGERSDMQKASELLVGNGLVVMNIDYRSARQYPHPAQLEDCREAVRWLRSNFAQYKVSPEQIGALGYSAGGHLALMLGLTDAPADEKVSSRVGAVVSGAGPTNLLEYPDSGLVKRFTGGQRITGRGHIWADASPITHVSADDPPVFFYHGRWDMVVKLRQTQVMATALEQANIDVVVDVQPFGHMLTHVFSTGALTRAASFLKKYLAQTALDNRNP